MIDFHDFYKLDNIVLNVANECPLRCSYCYANKIKGLMNKETVEIILDKSYKNHLEKGSKKKFKVSFYGGEPLLAWDTIKHCLEYCKEKQYDIEYSITTNLVILTDEMINYFKEYNIQLLISIDGGKEIHDKNRCNSYDIVVNNIQRLLDEGFLNNLTSRMTVTPECCKDLLGNIKSIIGIGFNSIETVPVTDMKWSDEDYKNFENGLNDVWEYVVDSYYNDNPINVKFVNDYLEKDLLIGNKKQIEVCNAGDCYNCSFGVNGDIMPCHQRHLIPNHYNDVLLGNIRENSVTIRENNFNKFIRKSNTYDCEKCFANIVCCGGCPSENLTQNSDANIMNETQCRITQIMYQTALFNMALIMGHHSLGYKLPEYLEIVAKNNDILSLIQDGFIKNFNEIEQLTYDLGNNLLKSVYDTLQEQIEIVKKGIDK